MSNFSHLDWIPWTCIVWRTDEGTSIDPKKIKIVVKWSVLNDKTEVKYFLELATYMRKYIKDFTKIAAPMMDLLKDKIERITWTCDCHESFEALKYALTKIPNLRIMNSLKCRLVLRTDASDMAKGILLM